VAFDLFRGQAAGQRDEVESYPTAMEHEIKWVCLGGRKSTCGARCCSLIWAGGQ